MDLQAKTDAGVKVVSDQDTLAMYVDGFKYSTGERLAARFAREAHTP